MSKPSSYRLGTRGSKLALWQANYVADALRKITKVDVEIVVISTEGDETAGSLMNPIRPGVFVSSIRDALIANEVDLVVHSMKDLPSARLLGLKVVAIPQREDARDVIISHSGLGLMALPAGAVVGTSSPRRAARINFLRPDLVTAPIRGNVDTRIQKVRDGEFDAVVLAAAGIKRLNRASEITEFLTSEQLLPAPAQGALAIEIRGFDRDLSKALEKLDHIETRLITTAERAVLVGLDASCQTAIGALATLDGNRLSLVAELSDGETNRHSRAEAAIVLENGDTMLDEAFQLGLMVAKQLDVSSANG
ncbi:MAG: hydroxymethylbilane synthase [Rhodoluna sp.]|nr:hydroxymethylbilane synthase [Rhodoluna sp.]